MVLASCWRLVTWCGFPLLTPCRPITWLATPTSSAPSPSQPSSHSNVSRSRASDWRIRIVWIHNCCIEHLMKRHFVSKRWSQHFSILFPPVSKAEVDVFSLCVSVVGFYIFRKSNSEKNAFRRNPSDPKLSRKFSCRLQAHCVMIMRHFFISLFLCC